MFLKWQICHEKWQRLSESNPWPCKAPSNYLSGCDIISAEQSFFCPPSSLKLSRWNLEQKAGWLFKSLHNLLGGNQYLFHQYARFWLKRIEIGNDFSKGWEKSIFKDLHTHFISKMPFFCMFLFEKPGGTTIIEQFYKTFKMNFFIL